MCETCEARVAGMAGGSGLLLRLSVPLGAILPCADVLFASLEAMSECAHVRDGGARARLKSGYTKWEAATATRFRWTMQGLGSEAEILA